MIGGTLVTSKEFNMLAELLLDLVKKRDYEALERILSKAIKDD